MHPNSQHRIFIHCTMPFIQSCHDIKLVKYIYTFYFLLFKKTLRYSLYFLLYLNFIVKLFCDIIFWWHYFAWVALPRYWERRFWHAIRQGQRFFCNVTTAMNMACREQRGLYIHYKEESYPKMIFSKYAKGK